MTVKRALFLASICGLLTVVSCQNLEPAKTAQVPKSISGTPSAAEPGRKKLIGHSWDLLRVTPEDLHRNLEKLEALPLDGISITVNVKPPEGKARRFSAAYTDQPWDRQWFAKDLEHIKAVCRGRLRHNLITSYWAPHRRLAWNDDAAWSNAAHNFAVIAWLAKQSGCKGILMDPEDYPRSQQYTLLPEDGNYQATAALARQRGAQVMRAMSAEFPDAVFLSFWFLSMNSSLYLRRGDPAENVARAGNLWVPFINGLLDALPPDAVMVDATENAYRHRFETYDFYKSALQISRNALLLVAPENHVKYRNQVQVGFGLYLDMYRTEPTSRWYFPELDGSRLKRLQANFNQAISTADEYCWVYGEKYDWIKWDVTKNNKDNETWEDILPGFNRTLALLRDPETAAREWLAEKQKAGTLVNLISNPECTPKTGEAIPAPAEDWVAGSLPPGWSFWQAEEKLGTFGLDSSKGRGDKFSARAEGTGNGCMIVKASVQAGRLYVVETWCHGGSNPVVRVRWTYNGAWQVPDQDVFINYETTPDAQGWRRGVGVAEVPAGVNELVVLMSDRLAPGETVWFDQPAVYAME